MRRTLLIISLSMAVSCSGNLSDSRNKVELSLVTRVDSGTGGITGAKNIQGISETDPYWGLSAYTPEGEVIFENVKMRQDDYETGDYEYSTAEYKPSDFVNGKPSNVSSLGGMILSAYYPYRGTMVENNGTNFPPGDEDISPRLTTNSLGHPAIHYGIPDYRVARHPRGYDPKHGQEGYFDYGVEASPRYSNPARDIVLFSCYKYVDAETRTSSEPVKIDLAPTTCRIAFVFSVAPRFDDNGEMAAVQPDSLDYQIVSVRRRRTGITRPAETIAHSNFNYDLKTGKITDMKFKTDGLSFDFPVKEGDPGYNAAWGPVNPYQYDTPKTSKVACVEFVSFPTVYDELQNIMFEIVYRYRLIRATDPLVDEDVWVTSTCQVSASSVYLVQGWRSGVVYRYHIYISRHEVDYEVELVPWEFNSEEDQFFGDIQV